jgi:glycosyltransferase involved in cell wall biosynthesis
MVGQFDIGLISLDRKLKTQNFPGKMLSYLVSGLPILASINPGNDLEGILRAYGVGLVAKNGDDSTFAANARRLIGSPELRDAMGRAGRRLLEERFAVTAAAKQILRVSGVGEGSAA